MDKSSNLKTTKAKESKQKADKSGNLKITNAKESKKKQVKFQDTEKISNKKKTKPNFSIYIHRIFIHIRPDPKMSLSVKTMAIMETFIMDMFDRIASHAAKLAKINRKSTITGRDIRYAVEMLLPGKLACCAVSCATKALVKYENEKAETAERQVY